MMMMMLSDADFRQLCRSGRPVELGGRTVKLAAPIKVGAADSLSIAGPGTIVGSGHSVFQVGGTAKPYGLRLRGLRLRHVGSEERQSERSLGACVFALGKGSVELDGCDVRSERGFAVWLRQRASGALRSCTLAAGRTAVALFNDSRMRMCRCAITAAAPHGVCARGTASVDLEACEIRNAAVRGIYAYMAPTVALRDVLVAGSRDPTAAAVQVEALRPGDVARLTFENLTLASNRGRGVAVAGRVHVSSDGQVDIHRPAPAAGRGAFGTGRPRNPLM